MGIAPLLSDEQIANLMDQIDAGLHRVLCRLSKEKAIYNSEMLDPETREGLNRLGKIQLADVGCSNGVVHVWMKNGNLPRMLKKLSDRDDEDQPIEGEWLP